jgi:hypothetical protein
VHERHDVHERHVRLQREFVPERLLQWDDVRTLRERDEHLVRSGGRRVRTMHGR